MKKRKLYLAITILVLIVSIISVSYALWGTNFTQASTSTVKTGCFNVTLEEGEAINLSNAYPIVDAAGKGTTGYTFTVKNTCTVASYFEVSLNTTVSSSISTSYIKAYIDGSKIVEPVILSDLPRTDVIDSTYSQANIIFSDYLAPASSEGGSDGEEKKYTLKLWLDESATKDLFTNLSYSGKISINATTPKSNVLAQRILAENSLNTQEPNFATGVPGGVLGYEESIAMGKTVNLSSNISGNRTIATGYTFDKYTGRYTLNGVLTNQAYNNSSVGMYTCSSTATSCTTLYKILTVNANSKTENYTQSSASYTGTLTSSSNRTVGTTLTFDASTGNYTLGGTITRNVSYTNYTGAYTCNSTATSCATAYKITTVSGTSVTASTRYTRTANYNYVTSADTYTAVSQGNQASGLFKSEDDDGTTYYFRGAVDNNYVSFGTHAFDGKIYTVTYNEAVESGEFTTSLASEMDAISECQDWYNYDYGWETVDECIAAIDSGYKYYVNSNTSDLTTEFYSMQDARNECNMSYNADDYGWASATECISAIEKKEYTLYNADDPIIWRVVRVNGDGTVRLITNNAAEEPTSFNSSANNHKYVGHTYDNGKICTKADPCDSTTGTSSLIKKYLENSWYSDSIDSNLDEKVALSSFCNDTTISSQTSSTNYYGAYQRLNTNNTPNLKCNDTTQTYGGYYKLKVGLLSADEVNMAGWSRSYSAGSSNYLYSITSDVIYSKGFWTMTPFYSTNQSYNLFTGWDGNLNYDGANINGYYPLLVVRPVISLNADVTISGGTGTADDPYVVE